MATPLFVADSGSAWSLCMGQCVASIHPASGVVAKAGEGRRKVDCADLFAIAQRSSHETITGPPRKAGWAVCTLAWTVLGREHPHAEWNVGSSTIGISVPPGAAQAGAPEVDVPQPRRSEAEPPSTMAKEFVRYESVTQGPSAPN